MPSSVTYIDSNAFRGYKSLTKIMIPFSVKFIGQFLMSVIHLLKSHFYLRLLKWREEFFSSSKNLLKVDIISQITLINCLTFDHCIELHEIKLFSSIKTIDSYAFIYCQNYHYCRNSNIPIEWFISAGAKAFLQINYSLSRSNLISMFNSPLYE